MVPAPRVDHLKRRQLEEAGLVLSNQNLVAEHHIVTYAYIK